LGGGGLGFTGGLSHLFFFFFFKGPNNIVIPIIS